MVKKITAQIILAILILVGLIAGTAFFSTQSTIQDQIYPFEIGKVFRPVFGSMECKYNEKADSIYIPRACGSEADNFCGRMVRGSEGLTGSFYRWVECPGWTGGRGCEITFEPFQCGGGTLLAGQPQIRINDGSRLETFAGEVFKQPAGSVTKYELLCQPYHQFEPFYEVTFDTMQLFVTDPEGFTPIGFVDGTEPRCIFTSTNEMELLQDVQEANRPLQQIGIGEDINIITGWKEEPTFGNVNSMGQFNGNDVMCDGSGLFKVDKVGTVGGIDYWKKGSQLSNFASTARDGCCPGLPCAGSNQVCENYFCVDQTEAIECSEGQCNAFQIGDTIENEVQEWDRVNNEFFLRTTTCDINACKQTTREEVECTQASCDELSRSTGKEFECDFNTGCFEILPKKTPCPVGQCCESTHPIYNGKTCDLGLECCIIDVPNDPNRGECAKSCVNPGEAEIGNKCQDGIDNDLDNLIDAADPDCQVCIVDGVDKKLPARECCDVKGGVWKEERNLLGGIKSQACIECSATDKLFSKECGGSVTKWVVGVLVGLLIIGMTFLVLNTTKQFKGNKNKGVKIFISIVAGLLAGSLIVLLWTELVVLIISLIVLAVIIAGLKIFL